MKHIKGASQAPTQLVLHNLEISQEKNRKNKLFDKKKKIKKKSKGKKLGYTNKGKKSNKKRRK